MDDTIRGKPSINESPIEETLLPPSNQPTPHPSMRVSIDDLIDNVSNRIFSCPQENKHIEKTPNSPIFDPAPRLFSSQNDIQESSKNQKKKTVLKKNFLKREQIDDFRLKFSVERTENAPSILKETVYSKKIELVSTKEQNDHLSKLLSCKKSKIPGKFMKILSEWNDEIALTPSSQIDLLLGKLIYLIDKLSESELKKIDLKNKNRLHAWIEKTFNKKLKEQINTIQQLKQEYESAPLQEGTVAVRLGLSLMLSDILVSEAGILNFGIIDELISHYLIHPDQENIVTILQAWRDQPDLRQTFALIEAPNSPKALCNMVIRTTLGMNSNESVTAREAKKFVLSALISRFRQGKDGSCFATPLAIVLLASDPKRCLDDFIHLIKEGKLTRVVHQVTKDFPFLLKMPETELNETLLIDKKGELTKKHKKGKIYQAPGLIAAAKAMGISDIKEAILNTLGSLSKQNEQSITLKGLLQALALEAKKLKINENNGLGNLYTQAVVAFQSKQSHPLLHIWSNALASMAEADETGMIKSAVIDTVIQTIRPKLKLLLPQGRSLRSEIKQMIRKILGDRIHLQYDPIIYSKTEDPHSGLSGFVLYDKNHHPTSENWQRIDHPKAFSEFISSVLENMIKDKSIQEKESLELQKKALRFVWEYAKTNDFLISCLHRYYYKNKRIQNPLECYQEIPYSPWVTKSGNDFSKVLRTYFENFSISNSETCKPKNPKELLMKILEIKKNNTQENNPSPKTMIPARIPKVHAFNIIFDHSSMKTINQNDPLEWINKNLLLPGKQLSEKPIGKTSYKLFLSKITEELVPKKMHSSFVLDRSSESASIKNIRMEALEKLAFLSRKKTHPLSHLKNQIDQILFQSLSQDVMQELKSTALHFADTNWSDGSHDIHLCFLVNPGSGELEIFAVSDDGKQFFPINPEEWIEGKKWEFFTEIGKNN